MPPVLDILLLALQGLFLFQLLRPRCAHRLLLSDELGLLALCGWVQVGEPKPRVLRRRERARRRRQIIARLLRHNHDDALPQIELASSRPFPPPPNDSRGRLPRCLSRCTATRLVIPPHSAALYRPWAKGLALAHNADLPAAQIQHNTPLLWRTNSHRHLDGLGLRQRWSRHEKRGSEQSQ